MTKRKEIPAFVVPTLRFPQYHVMKSALRKNREKYLQYCAEAHSLKMNQNMEMWCLRIREINDAEIWLDQTWEIVGHID